MFTHVQHESNILHTEVYVNEINVAKVRRVLNRKIVKKGKKVKKNNSVFFFPPFHSDFSGSREGTICLRF